MKCYIIYTQEHLISKYRLSKTNSFLNVNSQYHLSSGIDSDICTGLPAKWGNALETNTLFPISSGDSLEVKCKEGLTPDDGSRRMTCISGVVFTYNLDMVTCSKLLYPEWEEVEPGNLISVEDFNPLTTFIEFKFTQLKRRFNNTKFSLATRFYKAQGVKMLANINMFYHLNKRRVVKSKLRLAVRQNGSRFMYCNDAETLKTSLPLTLTQDLSSNHVVTLDNEKNAEFAESDCDVYPIWKNMVEQNVLSKVEIKLQDIGGNMKDYLLVHVRLVDTMPSTVIPATSHGHRDSITMTPSHGNLVQLDPRSTIPTCSVYPPGIMSTFTGNVAHYDLLCSHVLAADLVERWFVYGVFDEYNGLRSLSGITVYQGNASPFELQRGWMVAVNGVKFPIHEGVEGTIEGTGCSVLFENIILTATCPQFTVHYDGLLSAHIELLMPPTDEKLRAGLCFDEEDEGRIIPNNLQVSKGPECLITPGPREFCVEETEYCKTLTSCDSALTQACMEMFCYTDPSYEQLCALEVSTNMKCIISDLGNMTRQPKSCPDDLCDWLHFVSEAGCPQEPFFDGC